MIHKAKKSLGQNFLKSQEALRTIVQEGLLTETDTVIEIGPGKGALTEKLLEKAGKVIAIEKDHDLIAFLSEKFKTEHATGRFVLIEGDCLAFEPLEYGLIEKKYKIIANIPYNITGAILKKFLSETIQPSHMGLLVQKEVAERIVARDNKESILSVSVKAYGDPKYVMKVSKRFFSPAPKVDSAIISIKNISKDNFHDAQEEKLFFDIVKAGFAHKRKVLRKNLEDVLSKTDIQTIFTVLAINEKVRAEDIHTNIWLKISKMMYNK